MQNITFGKRPLVDRFREKINVNPDTGCWEWSAHRAPNGYGRFGVAGKVRYAHRVSYEMHTGPIPAGMELDHLCRVRHCVNPEHLEPVTHRENSQRGRVGQNNAEKTHCTQGHPYAGDNLYTTPAGKRDCRTCQRARQVAYRARKAQRVNGGAK
jgi:hypothetical protein